MAKNLSYKKTKTEAITVKGVVNDDATEITYVEDKVECTVKIKDILDKFSDQGVTLSIKCQEDEELRLDEE